MKRIESSIEINAPSEQVWAVAVPAVGAIERLTALGLLRRVDAIRNRAGKPDWFLRSDRYGGGKQPDPDAHRTS